MMRMLKRVRTQLSAPPGERDVDAPCETCERSSDEDEDEEEDEELCSCDSSDQSESDSSDEEDEDIEYDGCTIHACNCEKCVENNACVISKFGYQRFARVNESRGTLAALRDLRCTFEGTSSFLKCFKNETAPTKCCAAIRTCNELIDLFKKGCDKPEEDAFKNVYATTPCAWCRLLYYILVKYETNRENSKRIEAERAAEELAEEEARRIATAAADRVAAELVAEEEAKLERAAAERAAEEAAAAERAAATFVPKTQADLVVAIADATRELASSRSQLAEKKKKNAKKAERQALERRVQRATAALVGLKAQLKRVQSAEAERDAKAATSKKNNAQAERAAAEAAARRECEARRVEEDLALDVQQRLYVQRLAEPAEKKEYVVVQNPYAAVATRPRGWQPPPYRPPRAPAVAPAAAPVSVDFEPECAICFDAAPTHASPCCKRLDFCASCFYNLKTCPFRCAGAWPKL